MASVADSPGFDVVIVNWYAWDSLRRCVEHVLVAAEHLARSPAGGTARVVVVDNSLDPPPDDLLAWLSDKATLVRPGRNLGFGAGCNRGAGAGTAPLILFLNGDAWPHPDALVATAACLTDPAGRPGVVGGRMVDPDGRVSPSCWRFPSACRLTVEAWGLDRLRPFRDWGCRMRGADYSVPQSVDQVIGACFAIPRDAFEAVGGFDERYFLYYEEVDLCRKVRQAGYAVRFDPAIVFTHASGRMTPEALAPRLAYNSHSRIVYARKWFGRLGAVHVACLALVVEPAVRLAASIFSRRGLPPRGAGCYLVRLVAALRRGGWSRSVALD